MNRKKRMVCCVLALTAFFAGQEGLAQATESLLPIKEVTCFKDGHAYVLHEGALPVSERGEVVLDRLPAPILGTFWPYSAQPEATLQAVTAGIRSVKGDASATALPDLLRLNPGAEVIVAYNNAAITGKIVKVLPSGEGSTAPPPQYLVLRSELGSHILQIAHIQTITFKGDFKDRLSTETYRNRLTLSLKWKDDRPGKSARVGMVYVQKGLRWIPSYKLSIDGKGTASIKMQATLVNELADLTDATCNLVIGVPSFAFKDTPDPIALQQTFAQLGQYFEARSGSRDALSNAIMAQGRMGEFRGGGGLGGARAEEHAPDLGPEVGGSEKSEDLFVFTVKHVTLKKGERMVLPVTEYTAKYKDLYTLDLPIVPPPLVLAQFNPQQQAEVTALIEGARTLHKLRIANGSKQPFTTAPALLLKGDTVLAQGMMSYTAPGGDCDITLTTAVDVKHVKTEKETSRTPNTAEFQGYKVGRIDLDGKIVLTNRLAEDAEIEVTRYVFGHVGKINPAGEAVMLTGLDTERFAEPGALPAWWGWYGWPDWSRSLNGIGRFRWKVTVPAGKTADLEYHWHYFWH